MLLAAVIIGGGPLQLIPAVRSRVPALHRWPGRTYLLAAITSAIGGLYMVWTRGFSGDAVLILMFAAPAGIVQF